MESPLPLLDTSLRQSILRVRTLDNLNVLMTADVSHVVDHPADIAALCVAFPSPTERILPSVADAKRCFGLGGLATQLVYD